MLFGAHGCIRSITRPISRQTVGYSLNWRHHKSLQRDKQVSGPKVKFLVSQWNLTWYNHTPGVFLTYFISQVLYFVVLHDEYVRIRFSIWFTIDFEHMLTSILWNSVQWCQWRLGRIRIVIQMQYKLYQFDIPHIFSLRWGVIRMAFVCDHFCRYQFKIVLFTTQYEKGDLLKGP